MSPIDFRSYAFSFKSSWKPHIDIHGPCDDCTELRVRIHVTLQFYMYWHYCVFEVTQVEYKDFLSWWYTEYKQREVNKSQLSIEDTETWRKCKSHTLQMISKEIHIAACEQTLIYVHTELWGGRKQKQHTY